MFDFQRETGLLTIAGDRRDNQLRVWSGVSGAIEFELDGRRYSSDPTSDFFTRSLTNISSQTLRHIEFAGGLGDDRLIVEDLQLDRMIAIHGDEAIDVVGDVTAPDAVEIEAMTVRHDGTLSSSRIVLESQAETWVHGAIAARDGAQGGTIHILGDRIALIGADIDASGKVGGGQIAVGGERQGLGSLPNAQQVFVDDTTNIAADAWVAGDGGEAIVFAADSARVFGSLTARGGAIAGNGGFIETSGLRGLELATVPNVGAAHGEGGEWLINPYNINIVAGSGNININRAAPFESTSNNARLGVDLITEALASGDVTITTGAGGPQKGNINLNTALNFDLDAERTLTLNADHRIQIKNPIQASAGSAPLNLVLNGNNGTVTSGTGNIYINSSIVTDGGSITARGRATATYSTLVRGVEITSSGSLDSGGGDINLTGHTPITAFQGVMAGGPISSSGGDINITGSGEYSQGVFLQKLVDSGGGNITITGTGLNQRAITVGGDVKSAGGNITFSGHSANNHSIYLSKPINSSGGKITITGTTGNASKDGLRLRNTINSGSGDVEITADRFNLSSSGSASLKGTGELTLQPSTVSGNLTVGGSGGASSTFLNDTALGRIQDGLSGITIGRSDSTGTLTFANNLTFDDPIVLSAATIDPANFNLTTSNQRIAINGGVNGTSLRTTFDAGTGEVHVLGNIGDTAPLDALTLGGILNPGGTGESRAIGIDLGTNTLTFDTNDTLQFDILGSVAGSGYDLLNFVGSLDLGNASLSLNPGFSPRAGEQFTLLENDGTDAIAGTFSGLAEGASFSASGQLFRISYIGSDGNDIVITALAPEISVFDSRDREILDDGTDRWCRI